VVVLAHSLPGVMEQVSEIESNHADLIHDVAYDFYGKRIATCGSDHKISIFDQEEGGQYKLSGEIKVHSGSIWRVGWAHPEYGQVLASCSFDHTAKIWEEQEGATADGFKSQWVERATMSDSKKSVTGIAFAPRHLGLRLATCDEDGQIRIYEAMDVMNLSSWSQLEDFKLTKGNCKCLSWNPARGSNMLAIGCGTASGTNNLQLWELGSSKHWAPVLEDLGSLGCTVHDVAFAPTMGRTYYLLAAACSDKKVRIWKITSLSVNTTTSGAVPRTQYDYEEEEMLPFGEAQTGNVLRVSWNVTGTTLATSGDDNTVMLWMKRDKGQWECIGSAFSEDGPW